MHATPFGKIAYAAGVPMDDRYDLSATDVSAMLHRLDALFAQSRVLSAEQDAVLNEAEALIATITEAATWLDTIAAAG